LFEVLDFMGFLSFVPIFFSLQNPNTIHFFGVSTSINKLVFYFLKIIVILHSSISLNGLTTHPKIKKISTCMFDELGFFGGTHGPHPS
jgi:hypothetical protein